MTTNNTLQQQQRKRFHPKYSSPQSLFPSSGGTPTTFSDSHRSSSSSVAAVSTFKENLRRECLSKARLKRQERFLRARTKTSTAVNPYINNNNNSSSSQFQQQQDNEDCNVLARQLVQDEIRACRIEVVAHPSSSSRHLECVGPSPPLSASSSSSSSAAVHIYTTPDERHHPTTKYCTLSEEGGGERLVFNGEGDHSTPPHCSVTESSSNNPRFYFGDTFNKTSSSITEIMTNKTLQEQEYTKKDNNNNNNHLMNPYNYQTPPSSQLQFIPNGNCEHEHYDNDCIVITEEEAYDIMKEVEEELRREEAIFIQDIETIQMEEEMDMQQRILDYEIWNSNGNFNKDEGGCDNMGFVTKKNDNDTTPSTFANSSNHRIQSTTTFHFAQSQPITLCPICQKANLIQTKADVIVCPNYYNNNNNNNNYNNSSLNNNEYYNSNREVTPQEQSYCGSCTFRLDRSGEGLTIRHVSNAIHDASIRHGRSGCRGGLQFTMTANVEAMRFVVGGGGGVITLKASCSTCCATEIVI